MAPIQDNLFIGKLSCGFRYLTVNDLNKIEIIYSPGKSLCNRIFSTILFFFSGKGLVNLKNLAELLEKHEHAHEIFQNCPQLKQLLKIQDAAFEKISIRIPEKNVPEKLDCKAVPIEKIDPNKKAEVDRIINIVESSNPLSNLQRKQAFPPIKIENHPQEPIQHEYADTIENEWKKLSVKTAELRIEYVPKESLYQRYDEIFCPLETAVKVPGNIAGSPEEFLHANYVGKNAASKHQFIATQAPRENFSSFWKVAFKECDLIIDLTNHQEKHWKVTPYAPQFLDEPMNVGEMIVTLVKTDIYQGNRLHVYEVRNGDETKFIQRFHYSNWPVQGVISEVELRSLVDLFDTLFKDKKAIIHCRSGTGRTGTLVNAILLKEKIINQEITEANFQGKLQELMLGLRKERGKDFVQRAEQFNLLHSYEKSLLNAEQNQPGDVEKLQAAEPVQ